MKKKMIALMLSGVLFLQSAGMLYGADFSDGTESEVYNDFEKEDEENASRENEQETEDALEQFSDSDESVAEEQFSGGVDEEQKSQKEILDEEDEGNTASAEDSHTSGTCGKNLKWELSNGILTISGTGDMYNYGYSSYYYRPWEYSDIKRVMIKKGVTRIGDYAFHGCSSLTSITIPSGVTSIGYAALYGCSSLTSITIPSGVTRIGDYAFSGCSSLTDVYYEGSEAEWKEIKIVGWGNGKLENANIHYNSSVSNNGEKYALRPEQVWGFEQIYVTGNLDIGYYMKFFNPAHAAILLLADDGSNGYCSGMATSVNAISGYDCVPVSSFGVTNLNKLTDPKTISSVTWKSAADYIKYAHVYQHKSSVQKEARKHKEDLNSLYNAVKNSVSGNGDYVEIRIRGDYAGETNIGHCLLAMGIAKDTDGEVEILVYDGNFSSDLRKFYLYKQNGQITSWKYDQSAAGFLNWGTGRSNNQITYTTSGKKFKKDVTSIADKVSIDVYKYLISVKNENASVRTSSGSQSLNGSVTGDIIPLQIYNGTSASDTNVYWIDTEGEISIQNKAADNFIEIAGNNKTVSADIPVNSSASMNLNDQDLKTDVTGLSSGKSFSVTLTQYSDNADSTAVIVTGTASTKTVSVQKENGNKVNVKGVNQAEVQFQKEDGSTTQKVKVNLEGKPSQIEQNSNKTLVKQDSNGDGKYDKTVYDSSEVNIKVSAPKLGKISTGYNFLRVNWKKVSGADGYRVYRKVNSGKWKALKTTIGTSYKDKSVKAGYKYSYTVRAYKIEHGKKIYGSYNKKGLSGKLNTSIMLSAKDKAVSVKWKKTTGASGYYVYRAASKTGKFSKIKTITNAKTLKYIDKTVKEGKTYYYKVIPYRKTGNKKISGGSSTIKQIHIKKRTVKLNETALTLSVGESTKLKPVVNDSQISVSWRSSDISVATVSRSGCVIARNIGNCVITALVNKTSVSCVVTVIGRSSSDDGYKFIDGVDEIIPYLPVFDKEKRIYLKSYMETDTKMVSFQYCKKDIGSEDDFGIMYQPLNDGRTDENNITMISIFWHKHKDSPPVISIGYRNNADELYSNLTYTGTDDYTMDLEGGKTIDFKFCDEETKDYMLKDLNDTGNKLFYEALPVIDSCMKQNYGITLQDLGVINYR